MKTPILGAATLLFAGFGAALPARAVEPGWYFVAYGGEAAAGGLSVSQVEDNLVALFEAASLDVLDPTTTLDDTDTGFGFAGGYQYNDHFALEAAFVDLGSVGSRHTATLTDGVEQADAAVEFRNSADGAVFWAHGILPVGERLSVFARAGLAFLSATGTARITVDGLTERPSQSSQKIDPAFGVGAEVAIGRHFALRLAWDRYTDVGTRDVAGDIDADHLSLGVRMGVGWFR